MTAPVNEGRLFEANVYFARRTGGVSSPALIGRLAIKGMAITPQNEEDYWTSNEIGQGGKKQGAVSRSKPTLLKMSITGTQTAVEAVFASAATAAINETGGSVTGHTLSAGIELDTPYYVGYQNISAFAITGSVAGTDYEVVDAQMGIVVFLSGGNIAAASNPAMDITYGAITGTAIGVGAEPYIEVEIIGKLYNRSTGSYGRFRVPAVNLVPDGDIVVVDDKYVERKVKGECLLVSGETADCYIDDVVYA